MAELASLQISVDTRQTKQAASDLDRVAASAKMTEQATKAFGTSATKSMRDVAAANDNLKRGFGEASERATRLADKLDTTSRSLWAVAGAAGGSAGGMSQLVDGLDAASSLLYAGRGAGIIGGFAAAALTVAGLGLAAAKSQQQLVELAKSMDETAQSANTIRGLEILGAGAGMNKGDPTKALEDFRKAVREYRKDEGDLKDALEEVNKKYLDRVDKAQGVKGAFKEIVGILKEVNRADAEKIADAAFGEERADNMLRLIREQGKGYADIEAAAAAAGIAIDDGVVKQTAQAKRELDAANDIANTKLLSAFEALIAPLNTIYKLWIDIKVAIADAVDWVASFKFPQIPGGFTGAVPDTGAYNTDPSLFGTGAVQRGSGLDMTIKLNRGQYPDEATRRAGFGRTLDVARDLRSGRSGSKDTGGGGSSEKDQYEELVKATQQRIKSLQIEADALSMTADAARLYKLEQNLLLDAEKKGIELTPEKIEALKGYAAQLAETQKKIDDMKKAQADSEALAKNVSGAFKSFISDFRSGIEQGKSAWQAFADAGIKAVDRLLNKFIEAQLNDIFKQLFSSGGGGGGGFGGLFSGLFGGGGGGSFGFGFADPMTRMATGGPVMGPGTSTSDSIPARLSNGEYVVNAKATRKNRQLLDMINYGFADGGFVGNAPAGNGGMGSPVVQIVTTQKVEREERSRTPDGRELRRVILSDVKTDMGQGGFDSAMGARFAQRPALVSRG